jgi:hypothetical protein
MKPLTRAIVWIWIVMQAVGIVTAALLVPRLPLPATIRAIWWLQPHFQIAFGVVVGVGLILCGLALLQGRRWAWWVIVVSLVIDLGMSTEMFNRPASSHLVLHDPWRIWSAISSAIFAILVLIGLLGDAPPEDASDDRQHLKPLTLILGWLWVVLMAAGGAMFVGGFLASFAWFGRTPGPGAMTGPILATSALFLLLLGLAGKAWLKRRAWVWWTAVVLSGLGVLSLAPQGKYGDGAFCALSFVGLLFDPPRNWVESPAPEPPPEEPTPGLTYLGFPPR